MDFNLLFAIIGNLSFVIDFEILPNSHQDFLFFTGNNASAHLFRRNNTVLLNVADSSFETYQADIKDKLKFSWDGFKINGSEMKIVKTSGNVTDLNFDAFTVLSPILKMDDAREEPIIETLLTSEKLNYYYIFAIVFLSVLLFDSKPRTFRLIQNILRQKKEESVYEAMQANYKIEREHCEENSHRDTV